ncbi:MAG TPA: zf-HC2 domain-containing protein [Thermoanaerobaculia bacterium]|nr:zf-HC2 domain-containing protein [Thermoanaerobaculia bacterium]
MREASSDFRDTLVELIDTSPEPMEHPSPDRWIAYHRGELSADEEAFLQEHLVRCRDCFDLSEAAAAFARPDEEPGTREELETIALWRRLRPQLDPASGPSRQNVREISAGPLRRSSWRFRLASTLAASFFVALVGMTVWNVRLRAPKPDSLIVDFADAERLPTANEMTLSASTGPWTLVFHPPGELPVYRLALRDAATGREQWSYELRLDRDLALTIQLPEGLRPGSYRLELTDGSGGRVFQTHLLRVTEPGRGD